MDPKSLRELLCVHGSRSLFPCLPCLSGMLAQGSPEVRVWDKARAQSEP